MPVKPNNSYTLYLTNTVNLKEKMLPKELYERIVDDTYDLMLEEGSDLNKPYEPMVLFHRVGNLVSQKLAALRRGEKVQMKEWYADIYKKYFDLFRANKSSYVAEYSKIHSVGFHHIESSSDDESPVYSSIPRYSYNAPLVSLLLSGDVEANPGPNTFRKNKMKTKNRRRPTRRANLRPPHNETQQTDDFPLIKQMIQPSSIVIDFAYDLLSQPFNNPGGSIVSEVFQSNDAFDWLTSILTATMNFLNRQFQLYAKAKVLELKLTFAFTNLEQTEIDISFFSSPESQTPIASSKAAIQSAAATGIYRGGVVMSEQYGKNSKVIFSDRFKPGNVVGNMLQYRSSDDFSFTQSSNPPRITYYGWYATTPLSTIATGITRRVRIESRIYFYDMITITSNLFGKTRPLDFIPSRCRRDMIKTFTPVGSTD